MHIFFFYYNTHGQYKDPNKFSALVFTSTFECKDYSSKFARLYNIYEAS